MALYRIGVSSSGRASSPTFPHIHPHRHNSTPHFSMMFHPRELYARKHVQPLVAQDDCRDIAGHIFHFIRLPHHANSRISTVAVDKKPNFTSIISVFCTVYIQVDRVHNCQPQFFVLLIEFCCFFFSDNGPSL